MMTREEFQKATNDMSDAIDEAINDHDHGADGAVIVMALAQVLGSIILSAPPGLREVIRGRVDARIDLYLKNENKVMGGKLQS